MSETTFADLQADIKARLDGDKFLAGVPFIVEDKGDITADLEKSLAVLNPTSAVAKVFSDGTTGQTKVGICGIVRMPVGLDVLPDVLFGPLDFDVDITVVENPVLNEDPAQGGSGLRALVVARRVYRLLKNYVAAGIAMNLVPRSGPCIVPTEEFAPLPAYNVQFVTREADTTVFAKCATPIFTPPGGVAPVMLTLSCATAGAKIYWTADGSHPSPTGGGDWLLYGGPFATAAGRVYRAAAFPADLTTMIESDVAAVVVT